MLSVFIIFSLFTAPILAAENKDIHKIVLAAAQDFKPFNSKYLPNGGIATDIVRRAFQRAGYEIEVAWVPWPRALENAKRGTYDGILGAWYTKERTEFFTYSSPFLKNELVFFKRKGEPISYSSLKDLKPYRIGVAKDSAPHELLKPELGANLDIANTQTLSIRMLMGKRFDLIAEEKLSTLHLLNTQFPEWRNTIEAIDPPLEINNMYVVISKKNPRHQIIIDDFNDGLKKIMANGLMDDLRKQYGFQ